MTEAIITIVIVLVLLGVLFLGFFFADRIGKSKPKTAPKQKSDVVADVDTPKTTPLMSSLASAPVKKQPEIEKYDRTDVFEPETDGVPGELDQEEHLSHHIHPVIKDMPEEAPPPPPRSPHRIREYHQQKWNRPSYSILSPEADVYDDRTENDRDPARLTDEDMQKILALRELFDKKKLDS